MSLQWTLIATFLYVEMFIVLLLVLPFVSPIRWHRIFKSKFIEYVGTQHNLYFGVMLCILVLLFMDSIREMYKYSELPEIEGHSHQHLDSEMQTHMRLFRAQRNFYISGFALFLSLIIRRLVSLLSSQAILILQASKEYQEVNNIVSELQKMPKIGKKLTKLSDLAEVLKEAEKLNPEMDEKTLNKLRKDSSELISLRDEYNAEKDKSEILHEKLAHYKKEYEALLELHDKQSKLLNKQMEENSKDK